MEFKQHARFELARVRSYTNAQLEAFQSSDDWVFRPTSDSNHALWIIGHLALADNRFATRFREQTEQEPDGYEDIFWFGRSCQPSLDAFPPIEEVKSYFADRRANLLQVLEELSDAELDAPMPMVDATSPMNGAPSIGHYFLFAANHEMSHAGQLSVCRRGLGHAPLR